MQASVIPAASVVIIRKSRFLLVERARPPAQGLYAFPGGRAHPGETVENAARRELLEETGLTVENLQLLRRIDLDGSDPEHLVTYRLHVFLAGKAAGTARAGDDAARLGWYSLEEMEAIPVTESTREFARQLDPGADTMLG